MKLDKFSGYVEYESEEFVFNYENFYIELLPSNHDKFITQEIDIISKIINNKSTNDFINDRIIFGLCFDGRKVAFCISDSPNTNLKFRVKWVYLYKREIDDIKIDGISFSSPEIDYYYNPSGYIQDSYDDEKNSNIGLSINVSKNGEQELGKFSFNKNEIRIFGNKKWSRNYDTSSKLEVNSSLYLKFENSIYDLNIIYELIILQKLVLNVLTYRNNNSFDSIEIHGLFKDKPLIIGNFYIESNLENEINYKEIKHIIKYENIDNIGKLYKLIDEGKVYTSHFCNSIKSRREYTSARMLGIMIAFERFINWKYTKKEFRNEQYLEFVERTKQFILDNKELLCEGFSNKKIKFKSTIDSLIKPQTPFSSYISKVYNDYDLTDSIIRTIYGVIPTKELKNDIAQRVNKLRNDMAHGNMDIKITIDNTKDIKFMELIFYVLILKELGVNDDKCKEKIAWLFNINPFF